MRRVLITAVVNSRLIYHRYTRYLWPARLRVHVHARIPAEELEGRRVHYVIPAIPSRPYLYRDDTVSGYSAEVTAAVPPSPNFSLSMTISLDES